MNWKGIADWLKSRLREKSTWVGLIGLLASAGAYKVAPEQADSIATALTLLMGGVLVGANTSGDSK